MNLIDRENDDHIHRVESTSRLHAARLAKAWWEEHREQARARSVAVEPAGVTFTGGSIEIQKVPRPEPDQAAILDRLRLQLVWTRPDPDDPESYWMIEVFREDGTLAGIAQPTALHALLTVFEDIIPPGEPA